MTLSGRPCTGATEPAYTGLKDVEAERARPRQEPVVKGIVRDVFLPWFNSFRFFLQAASRLELDVGSELGAFARDEARALASTNVMDRWIFAAAHSLVAFVRAEMDAYRLYTTVPRILSFVEQLTNWCVRVCARVRVCEREM